MNLTEYPIQQLKAEFFKTLGHPPRIRILEALGQAGHEISVTALVAEVGLEPSHMSQQLAHLRRTGLVTSRREGSTVYYTLRDQRVLDLLLLAKEILADAASTTRQQLTTAELGDQTPVG